MAKDVIDLLDPVADHPLNDGLVGWWMPLENNWGGSYLYDLCGKSHGTLTNFPTGCWGAAQDGSGTLTCDGVNDYVSIGTNTAVGKIAGALTAVVVLRTTDAGSPNRHLIGAYVVSPPYTGWGLSLQSGWPQFWSNANAGGVWLTSSGSITDGLWHHLIVTGTGTSGAFYLDGAPRGTFTFAAPGSHSGSVTLMARSDGAYHCGGTIQSIAVLDRAVTAEGAKFLHQQWQQGYPDLLKRTPARFWPAAQAPSLGNLRRILGRMALARAGGGLAGG